jgi:RNA polymerase-binding protein DksA
VNREELRNFEKKLLEERKRLLEQMNQIDQNVVRRTARESSGDLSVYPIHPADLGTDTMEREKEFLLVSSEGSLLKRIDEALQRIYDGTYGNCERCEKKIERSRLSAVPSASLCLQCQKEEEAEGA